MCFSALLYAAEIGYFWFCLKKMLKWNGKWRSSSVYWHLKHKTLTDWHYEQTIITRSLDLRTWRLVGGLAVKGLSFASVTKSTIGKIQLEWYILDTSLSLPFIWSWKDKNVYTFPWFRWKPDLSDHNGQNLYPFSDQNGSKTIPFGAAHTYIAYIGEYPPPPPGGQIWVQAQTDVIFSNDQCCLLLIFSSCLLLFSPEKIRKKPSVNINVFFPSYILF